MSSLKITKTLSLDTLRVNKFLAVTASNTDVPADYAFISNGNGVAEWRDLNEYTSQLPQEQINDISGRLNAILENVRQAATSGTVIGSLNVNTRNRVIVFGVADSSGRTMYSYKNNTIIPCINPIIGTVYTIIYDCGRFVAVGADDNHNCIKWSLDGVTWTDAEQHPFDDIRVPQNVACDGKGRWIAVGFDPDGTAIIAYSDLFATHWTQVETPVGFEFANSIAQNGLMWIACGGNIDTVNQQSFIYSYNGIEWITDISGGFNGMAMDLVWNGKLWVAVGYDDMDSYNTIKYSPDGINWYPCISGSGYTFRKIGHSIGWNGREFVATGDDIGGTKTIAWSIDGLLWTIVDNAPPDYVKDCFWDGTTWLAIGLENVYTSIDGRSWLIEIDGFPDSVLPGVHSEITCFGGNPLQTLLTVDDKSNLCGINKQFPIHSFDINGSLHVNGITSLKSRYINENTTYTPNDSLIVGADTFVIDIGAASYNDIRNVIYIPISARTVMILNAGTKQIFLPKIETEIPYSFIVHNKTSSSITLYDPNGLSTIYSRDNISSTYVIGSNNIVQMCGVRNYKNGDGQVNETLPYIYYRFSGLEGVDLSGYNIQQQLDDILAEIEKTRLDISDIETKIATTMNTNILTAIDLTATEISTNSLQVDSTAVISNCIFQNAVITADSTQLRNTYNRFGASPLTSSAITIKSDKTLIIDRTYLYDINNAIRLDGTYNKVIVHAVNEGVGASSFIELPNPLTEDIMVDEITILNVDIGENTINVRVAGSLPVILVEASSKNNRRVNNKNIEIYESYTFKLIRNYRDGIPVISPNPYYWVCK